MNRRRFVSTAVGGMLLSGAAVGAGAAGPARRPRIVLRSSWQTVNIGDIAHSPGVMRLLSDYIPEADVTLWPMNVGDGVREMLERNFPQIRIIGGRLRDDGSADNEELERALSEADFLLHGSGPSIVAARDLGLWRKRTDKPYGIDGITISSVTETTRELMDNAQFVYFRDSVSLKLAQDSGVRCPIMEFGPDGAFAVNLRNDPPAEAFLAEHGLEPGRFLVAIPLLRYTPYYKMRGTEPTEEDLRRKAISDKMKDSDHAKVREAIVAFVRETKMKVLAAPEVRYQIEVAKEQFVDKMPDDVRPYVVWRDKFWLTDEAVSVYARAFAMIGMDMHSPIMAVANGTPTVHCRFKEQTSKNFMWRDIGLGDWLFDIDEQADGANITAALLGIARDPAAARAKVAKAMDFVHERQKASMEVLRKCLGL
jgi:polysaccharide pyruvyl transferase WcaK-like protein